MAKAKDHRLPVAGESAIGRGLPGQGEPALHQRMVRPQRALPDRSDFQRRLGKEAFQRIVMRRGDPRAVVPPKAHHVHELRILGKKRAYGGAVAAVPGRGKGLRKRVRCRRQAQ